jgi:succinyl-CoA synthetase alpha subunit
MNTVDALTAYGGHCANFLDTGGKATSETVRSSFRIVLSDPRVKAIFVNVFGGLTLCDMIAEGIIMAFRDLGMKVPVVVRLRGTNEEIGQRMVCWISQYIYIFLFHPPLSLLSNLVRNLLIWNTVAGSNY